MNIPEEIVEALVEHYGADAVRSALDQMQAQAQYEEFARTNLQPLRYWDHISEMNGRQEAKGLSKYGQPLEENTDMPNVQRIEHAQEEAIDLLKYLEHLKQTVQSIVDALCDTQKVLHSLMI